MNRNLVGAVAGALLLTHAASASTVTVLGSSGGRIWYDGQDVGSVPLRLTAVPPGQHHIRVLTPDGASREFDLAYPTGQQVDRVVDLDVVARSEIPSLRASGALPASGADAFRWNPARDSVTYTNVLPGESSGYSTYPYDTAPYAGGAYPGAYDTYPYGGYSGYYGGSGYGFTPYLSGSHAFFRGGHSGGHHGFSGHHGSSSHLGTSSQHASSSHRRGTSHGHRSSGSHHHHD